MRSQTMTKRAAIYARVSTDEQTTANQVRRLREVAKAAGWSIVNVYTDDGISGAKGREKRPAFDALCKASVRREHDVVMCWSVDRLGRSLQHLVTFLNELHSVGVDLFIHVQALDTTTPAGKAMFGMLGIFSEFERSIICERVKAGLARVQEDELDDVKRAKRRRAGKKAHGRPSVLDSATVNRITVAKDHGMSYRKIAAMVGVSLGSVQNALALAA